MELRSFLKTSVTGHRQAWQYLEHQRFRFFLVFLFFLALYTLTAAEKTHFDEHVRLATALLHGHVWIESPPSYIERAISSTRRCPP
jgi:hypothetical protein